MSGSIGMGAVHNECFSYSNVCYYGGSQCEWTLVASKSVNGALVYS